MAHLSLSFLGGFEVTLDAEPITTFGADKARALLAHTAVRFWRQCSGPMRPGGALLTVSARLY